ncbi:RICIN domain-containing protein [Fodinicola acaciae]|uniref:RICIN domain-containing protein n=1 Tax=Fodinicola acaciae TaxID=2681555 RepID=UPI0013D23C70|nr:ricin-type beta-trefoil lectin domain protein [Fodinicola acaciae]
MLVIAAPAGAATATGAQPAAASATSIYYVKNANTGRCLTANQLVNQFDSVFTNDCVGAASQRWRIVGGQFQSQGITQYCLSAGDDSSIYTEPCFGRSYYPDLVPFQRWLVDATEKKWIKNQQLGFCVHSGGGAVEYVIARTCGSDASRWIFAAA